jgi:putative polyketide hydroxylase
MLFEQDDGTGVTAVLQDRRTGTEHTLQRPTTYLIAADGANSSSIRRRRLVIGVRRWPQRPVPHTITAIVEADLTPALRGRRVDIACVPPAPAVVHRPTGA